MLSSSTIKNVGQASHYFSEQDNYYSREEGLQQSEWWGKGAQKMNLADGVDGMQFSDLLQGKLPNGEILGKMVDGQIKHRPGWDLTFSAPKSVSIMALVGGDARLMTAHREAVGIALSHIEQSCGQARIKLNGQMAYQNTGNIIGALYHHDLSRAKDPQMHTHSVIMNMTQRTDGKWRSLASSVGRYNEQTTTEVNGFIERVRHHNRYYSKVYEAELAFRVKQLGYEIKNDTSSGIFEIADIPREVIDHFSKRRHDIEAMLEDKGLSGGKAAAVATLSTRDDKSEVDREQLKKEWIDTVKTYGLDLDKIIDKSIQKQQLNSVAKEPTEVTNEKAIAIIRESCQTLAVFQSTFSLEQIIAEVSKEAIAKHIDIKTLLGVVDQEIKDGKLLSLANEQGKTLLMSKNTIDDEKSLIEQIKSVAPITKVVSESHLEQALTKQNEIPTHLHESLKTIFDHDRIVLIEGEENKKNLVEPIMKISQSADLNVVIVSPTLVGSKQLAKNVQQKPIGIWENIKALFVDNTTKHFSVMQFLSQFEKANSQNKCPDILLVDQAHLLSTHQKAKLMIWSNHHQTKILLFGNNENLLPYQVSTSLQQLSEHGVKTINAPTQEAKINMLPTHEINLAKVKQLCGQTIEVSDTHDRHTAIAMQFARLSPNDRQSSWLVTYSKINAEQLNQATHDQLKKDGLLSKPTACNILAPVFIPAEKAKLSSSYEPKQVVRFNDDYTSLGISRGEYLRITQLSKQSNRIILQKENGERVVWRPDRVAAGVAGKVEVFQVKERELCVGESIVLLRSIKSKGLVKGERLQIDDIQSGRAKLRDASNKAFSIDLAKPYNLHIDYSYAATLHAITHEKAITLIADLPSKTLQTDQRRVNQIFSQSSNIWLYTDDAKKLITTLEKQTGDKLSAHDVLSKSVAIKSSLHAMYDLLEKEIAKQPANTQSDHLRQAINAVDYSMKHLAERQAGFSHKDLMQTALQHALGNVTEKSLTEVTVAMEKSGILLRGHRNDGTLWTTAEAVKMERGIISLALKDKGKMTLITSESLITQYADSKTLRSEQIEAIKNVVMSSDRVLSIQGRAGTGKTMMMTSLDSVITAKELFTDSGYILRGIAPTHKAVKELSARGIQSQTIDSFLSDMRKIEKSQALSDHSKTLLVIDEASMVSNRKMLDVLRIAHEFNFCRVIPTGDIHQNPAIEAGKPHDLIQQSLGKVIHLKDIQRQKNPILKEAALALYDGDIKKSFSVLDDHIIQLGKEIDGTEYVSESKLNYTKRVGALVADYFSLTAQGEQVQIIAPAHDDRKAINNEVRLKLNETGVLKGESHGFSVFSSKDMTQVERSRANNFKLNDVIKFASASGKNIQAGDYFQIKSIDTPHNALILTKINGDGKEVFWQVPQSSTKLNTMIETFKREDRQLQVGDKIIWTRTNKKESIISTELAEVTRIDSGRISTKRHDNSVLVFDATDPKYQHWDHAYALTTYSTQGGTYSTVLGLFESYRKNLMNLKTFLVTVTRAVNNLRIYTDDKEKLQNRILDNRGDKLSSLEVIGKYPDRTAKQAKSHPQKSSPNSYQSVRLDRYTMERIVAGLNKDAEKIATDILGNPKVRGSNFVKFGSHQGSLSVTTKGERQGWWNDFADNAGGRSMLSFLQKYAGLSKREAVEYGAKWVGIHSSDNSKETPRLTPQISTQHTSQPDVSLKEADKKKIAFAQKLAEQSQSVAGTIVERYLKEQRAIDLKNHPEDIRFHSGVYSKLNGKTHPAMLVIARDHQGNIKAVQATYLDPATATKVDKSQVVIQKQTFGAMKGAAVTIEGKKGAPTLIAEGIETGLSLKQAIPHATIKITLSKSNFKNIDTRTLSDKTILCLDNDGKDLKRDKVILESTKRLVADHKQVSLMVPSNRNQPKQDYNDILKMDGTHPIKNDFDRAISARDFYGKAIEGSHSAPVAPEKISKAARQIQVEDQRNNQKLVATHRAMTRDTQQREPTRSMTKHPDIERSI